MFYVRSRGSFAHYRTSSVECDEGFIAGTYRQFVLSDDLPISCIRPAGFSAGEAIKMVDKLNAALESGLYDKNPTVDDIDGIRWSIQL